MLALYKFSKHFKYHLHLIKTKHAMFYNLGDPDRITICYESGTMENYYTLSGGFKNTKLVTQQSIKNYLEYWFVLNLDDLMKKILWKMIEERLEIERWCLGENNLINNPLFYLIWLYWCQNQYLMRSFIVFDRKKWTKNRLRLACVPTNSRKILNILRIWWR